MKRLLPSFVASLFKLLILAIEDLVDDWLSGFINRHRGHYR